MKAKGEGESREATVVLLSFCVIQDREREALSFEEAMKCLG